MAVPSLRISCDKSKGYHFVLKKNEAPNLGESTGFKDRAVIILLLVTIVLAYCATAILRDVQALNVSFGMPKPRI